MNAFGNLPDLYRESNIPTLDVSIDAKGVTFCILRPLLVGEAAVEVQWGHL